MISPARAPFHWTEALNGREWATVVWAAVALVVMLARGDTRPSVVSVFRAALHRAILTPVLLLLVYVAAVVFVATRVSLWNERLIGATLAWIAASALVGFFKINEVPDERHPLRAAFRRALAITVLVDAYVNFAVFPFAIELVAIPFLFVLGGVMVVAEMKDEFENHPRATEGICRNPWTGRIRPRDSRGYWRPIARPSTARQESGLASVAQPRVHPVSIRRRHVRRVPDDFSVP